MTSFVCERDSADLSMNSLPLSAISFAALVTAFLISSIEPVEISTTDLAFSAVSSKEKGGISQLGPKSFLF
jgi:hypothetical protein